MLLRKIVFLLSISIVTTSVSANEIDLRYCGEPKRSLSGKILRSVAERHRFEQLYPLPPQYNRDNWQVDHVIPLSSGGCDNIVNMQWLPKDIKTCAAVTCKDRWERIIYKVH